MTDIRLDARVIARSDTEVTIEYSVENTTGADVVLCNRLHQGPPEDGPFVVEPDLTYVLFEPGPRPNVTKRIPDRDGVFAEYPIQPCGTVLAPGERFEERVTVALPLHPFDPYRLSPRRDASLAEPSTGLTVTIGWIPRDELDDLLLPEVDTTAGRLPIVKAGSAAQRLARIDLDDVVPVVAPGPSVMLQRTCVSCGAVNRGEQQACLQCSTPLPAPPASGWQPTHVVPDGGMEAWDAPDPSGPFTTLAGGLPVQVVEQLGDWARVVASNSWSGWVDARRLVPS